MCVIKVLGIEECGEVNVLFPSGGVYVLAMNDRVVKLTTKRAEALRYATGVEAYKASREPPLKDFIVKIVEDDDPD